LPSITGVRGCESFRSQENFFTRRVFNVIYGLSGKGS
jgi:hypothetical protein